MLNTRLNYFERSIASHAKAIIILKMIQPYVRASCCRVGTVEKSVHWWQINYPAICRSVGSTCLARVRLMRLSVETTGN